MEFGFNIPNGGPLANNEDIVAISRKGEDCGFSLLAIPDHIIIPREIGDNYPYSSDGKLSFSTLAGGMCLEPLAMMAAVAGQTRTARILTSVMVVPYREPVLTAKLVSTIDHLSGGRTILGCGAGWMPEEFEAVGAEPFAERGRVTDEYIDIYRELWTKEEHSTANTAASQTSTFRQNQCRPLTRQSGWVAKARRPCAGPCAGAMRGTRSVAIPITRSIR